MKRIKTILLIILSLNLGHAQSIKNQERQLKKVTKDYDKYAYVKTSEILLKVAEKGYKSVALFQKLGNAYYFNTKMEAASKWYGELMSMEKVIDAEYYYRYAQALKGIGNYGESDKWMLKFHKEKPLDLRAKAFITTPDYLAKIEKVSNKGIKIRYTDFNTEVSDFGTTQYKDELIFASSRGGGRLYKWNEQPYLDLYTVKKDSNGSYTGVSKLDKAINSKYHESTASFTPDDNYIYFTRNNYYKGRYGKDKSGTNKLKIFRAELAADGTWENLKPVHFNSDAYSVAHPSVNVSGTTLYFASDMQGAQGLSDLYEVAINKDGSLGNPENLGITINTEAKETFPFISKQGDLYFSSDGHPGLGGLDIYVIRNYEAKKASGSSNYDVENIGKPFNSSQDDFGYYENLGTEEGFFTSNRAGGKGDDDIYIFTREICEQFIVGLVKDLDSKALLPYTKVTLYDKHGNELSSKIVGEDAAFSFELECEKAYLVRGEKAGYSTDEIRLATSNTTEKQDLELLLDKDVQKIEPCDDLAKLLDIPIIYFDFDKFHIRYDAEVELQKVLAVMEKYPTMEIDIRSHTDCRGRYGYNESLSENRAKSTRKYLISKGISAERLTSKGYGESQLVNDCGCEPTNASSCKESEHQLNRRSEFIVTRIQGKTCAED